MSILVNKDTRLMIQGITGNEGLFHSQQMLEYGTNIVAGVTPGKGGEWVLDGKVPVFDSVSIAANARGANTSVIFVPARFAPDAIFEAADAGIQMIVCITEGIPVQDMMRVRNYLDQKGRHYPRRHRPPWQCGRGLSLRHLDLRGALRPQTGRDRCYYLCGYWG